MYISNKQLKVNLKNSFALFLIGYLEISLTEEGMISMENTVKLA